MPILKPITRTFAFLLALSLVLPNPAFALRVQAPLEDPARKAGLEQALSPAAAGTEETFRLEVQKRAEKMEIENFLWREWRRGIDPIPLLSAWFDDQAGWQSLLDNQRREITRWLVNFVRQEQAAAAARVDELYPLFWRIARQERYHSARTWAIQGARLLSQGPDQETEVLRFIDEMWEESFAWNFQGARVVRDLVRRDLHRTAGSLQILDAAAWLKSHPQPPPPSAGTEEETLDQMVRRLGSSSDPVTLEHVEAIRGVILDERERSAGVNIYSWGSDSRAQLADLLGWINTAPKDRARYRAASDYADVFEAVEGAVREGRLNPGDPVLSAALPPWAMGNMPVFLEGNHRVSWALMNILLLRSGVLREPLEWREDWKDPYYQTLNQLDLPPFVAFLKTLLPPAAGTEEKVLTGHSFLVRAVAFSSDGKTIASGEENRAVILWDAATGERRFTIPTSVAGPPAEQAASKKGVAGLSFGPNGELVAVLFDETLLRIDPQTGTATPFRFESDSLQRAWAVAFSPDGQSVVAGGMNGLLFLRSTPSGQLESPTRLAIPGGEAFSLSFSPDGKRLAAGGVGSIHLVERDSRNLVSLRDDGRSEVNAVAFSPDGKWLASGNGSGVVKLWDVAAGSAVELGRARGFVRSVAFSPDGKFLAEAGMNGSVRLWGLESQKLVKELNGHNKIVHSLAFSPDGKVLASGSADQTVRLWNLPAAGTEETEAERLADHLRRQGGFGFINPSLHEFHLQKVGTGLVAGFGTQVLENGLIPKLDVPEEEGLVGYSLRALELLRNQHPDAVLGVALHPLEGTFRVAGLHRVLRAAQGKNLIITAEGPFIKYIVGELRRFGLEETLLTIAKVQTWDHVLKADKDGARGIEVEPVNDATPALLERVAEAVAKGDLRNILVWGSAGGVNERNIADLLARGYVGFSVGLNTLEERAARLRAALPTLAPVAASFSGAPLTGEQALTNRFAELAHRQHLPFDSSTPVFLWVGKTLAGGTIKMFNAGFREEGPTAFGGKRPVALPLALSEEEFPQVFPLLLAHPQVAGMDITTPFKEPVASNASQWGIELDQSAAEAGSASLILKKPGGTGWIASMLDGEGWVRVHEQDLPGKSFQGVRVALFGAGGAGRPVLLALVKRNPAFVTVIEKDPGRREAAQKLLASSGRPGTSYLVVASEQEAREAIFESTVKINATPLGKEDDLSPLKDIDLLRSGDHVFDLNWWRQAKGSSYGRLTPWLGDARYMGAVTHHGMRMSVYLNAWFTALLLGRGGDAEFFGRLYKLYYDQQLAAGYREAAGAEERLEVDPAAYGAISFSIFSLTMKDQEVVLVVLNNQGYLLKAIGDREIALLPSGSWEVSGDSEITVQPYAWLRAQKGHEVGLPLIEPSMQFTREKGFIEVRAITQKDYPVVSVVRFRAFTPVRQPENPAAGAEESWIVIGPSVAGRFAGLEQLAERPGSRLLVDHGDHTILELIKRGQGAGVSVAYYGRVEEADRFGTLAATALIPVNRHLPIHPDFLSRLEAILRVAGLGEEAISAGLQSIAAGMEQLRQAA